MNFEGIIIAAISFFIIGIFHPIVIKLEYYLTKNIWPLFLILGIIFIIISLFQKQTVAAAIMGIIGATCIWSIKEIFEQEKRVQKGWFPKNPRKK
ncbi:prepilin signal peptidase PulO-like enzyme (type II secretory pathway) [Clostridium acetobutylicum]|uniref:Predicted membrane protein n=1 Tax=Clostridium acetobutylicum (strain ATCC 824 / DSM 792 / JCM 1419 / IAM 19013 / LMG 5710 / NBRC 13948 / NRRL B-527 / VKM B-1787 / 2291 / W) TaxID=272562 RepID=Q97D04_CLOAB|nr:MULTISPECIES: DUF4491 family protein [Clostridium]AAK81606.1 Predicted membrane protein [Clostridium acetobutylicum ATCC 824]ADZ22729.1 membrane protein [Clostridium acetobutylicum EA 2018]AEI32988.1 hypothetical protein SMB_G3726 [Clostridium acetobutylicum DSM 1731]AWV80719.1 DUF4491 family protein [Clostridium acetobutylicum]KHD35445.1 membrane protein [Clostridium acetobutylicum]